MKSLFRLFVSAWLCLLPAVIYADQDAKDIPVQQETKHVSEDEWRFTLTSYLWLPSTHMDMSIPERTIGPRTIGGQISVDLPWWEMLGKLGDDFLVLSLAGRLETWKGRWGGFLDGYWIFGKSTVDGSRSGLVFRDRVDITTSVRGTSRFDFGQVSFGPQFVLGTTRLSADSRLSFILYGGGRVNWIGNDADISLTITASALPGEIGETINFESDASRTFIEPMIGLKTQWVLGRNVDAIVRADVGGFGVVTADNWDCDIEAAIAWRVGRHTSLDFGYRARGQWQDLGSGGATAAGWFHGPELGLSFTF